MTTYLGKSCSFGLPRVPFINCRQFMYLVISLLVLRAGCGIVSVSDHCLSFYLVLCMAERGKPKGNVEFSWLSLSRILTRVKRHLRCDKLKRSERGYVS